MIFWTKKTYMGVCVGVAKIASFALSLYFSKRASPFVTCISSKGLPMQNNEYVDEAMLQILEKEYKIVGKTYDGT
jgi:hypothetical protein